MPTTGLREPQDEAV